MGACLEAEDSSLSEAPAVFYAVREWHDYCARG